MDPNPNHNIPNNIVYPLTADFINGINSWCRFLPVGVRNALINQYADFVTNRDGIIAHSGPGNMRNRLLRQREEQCNNGQRQVIADYVPVANNWRQRNDNWTQLRNQLLNDAQLNQAVQNFNTEGQGPQQAGIRVGHINLNSLLTEDQQTGHADKFENLRIFLAVFNFDVFVVGESKVKGVENALLSINGYNMIRLDRDYPGDAYNDGGLLVYVRNNLAFNVRNRTNRVVEDGRSLLQLIDFELDIPFHPNIRVVAVYNPPWGGEVAAMRTLLNDYRDADPNIIILGDININILGNENQEFQNFFQQNPRRYRQCIQAVTRQTANTLIDHIYTRQANWGDLILESGVVLVLPADFADHHLIFCTLRRD